MSATARDRYRERSGSTKKDGRLEEIYRTAAAIIQRDGYDATSLGDIARAVGLTKAGLYHYIPSKEDLLYGIMTYGMDRTTERVIAATRDISDPGVRIREIVASYTRLIVENGGQVTIIITAELHGLAPERGREITRRKRAFYEYVRDTISEIKRLGRAPVLDVSVTTFGLFGVVLSMAHWYRPDGKLSLQQIVEETIELTVDRMIGLDQPGMVAVHPPADRES